MEQTPWGRALIILGVIAVALYLAGELWRLVSHFADIMILFFLAWLVAFILLPAVRAIEVHLGMSRVGAAALVYVVLLVGLVTLVVLGVPLLIEQLSQLAVQLPALASRIPNLLRDVQATLDQHGLPISVMPTGAQPGLGQEAAQLGSRLVEHSVVIASSLASGFFDFTIILILSFYLVLDGDRFLEQLLAAIPEHYADDAREFFVSIDRSFGGFLRGTAIQVALLGLGTALVMSVSGLRYVLLVSIFAGVAMVVPFVGPFLALVVPLAIAAFSNLPTSQLAVIFVALGVLQVLVMNVVTPKVLSDSVGLHPLLVFLALLVGIKEAGLAGALFGVPVAAVIYATGGILLRRWRVIRPTNGLAAVPIGPSATVRVVHLERVGWHLGRAISRLFNLRPS